MLNYIKPGDIKKNVKEGLSKMLLSKLYLMILQN